MIPSRLSAAPAKPCSAPCPIGHFGDSSLPTVDLLLTHLLLLAAGVNALELLAAAGKGKPLPLFNPFSKNLFLPSNRLCMSACSGRQRVGAACGGGQGQAAAGHRGARRRRQQPSRHPAARPAACLRAAGWRAGEMVSAPDAGKEKNWRPCCGRVSSRQPAPQHAAARRAARLHAAGGAQVQQMHGGSPMTMIRI